MSSKITGVLSGITDWLGLTDTEAGQRGYDALEKQANEAEQQLNEDMSPILGMYSDAMTDRNMSDVLDDYDTSMTGEQNSGNWSNVQNYLNPMYGRAMRNASDQALAGAGSALQSSAANTSVTNAVGNQSTNMWQQAFQNAMADSQNNQNIYTSKLNSNLIPSLSWAQLGSDLASTKYTKNMDLANAGASVAGQSQGMFANLF